MFLVLKDGKRWLLRFGLSHGILCCAECLLLSSDQLEIAIALWKYALRDRLIGNIDYKNALTFVFFYF